ncbi:peptide chain release factor N(5)-glutamine methyltransferase [Candidatus Saccharibacteria bacterium]|nr:MAG: peptide chain release factor N(5)-glutamine methyltransferase [Candidatus Saccharibacteria bacterium]
MVKKSSITPIRIWLREAAEQLADVGISSALLDAELILAHTLRKSRTYLHAHEEDGIEPRELDIANARLDLRLDRTPLAYIVGHRWFYGRQFKVTPAVLIPRPESEVLIELLKKYINPSHRTLLDIGTGSGCLGITAKLEHPELTVTLLDISRHALIVAEQNASDLHARVATLRSDLLASAPRRADVILANLPYVDKSWERSPETNYEPELALFADKNGTALIKKLIEQAIPLLPAGGLLIIEADPYQHAKLIQHASSGGLSHLETLDYGLVFVKP